MKGIIAMKDDDQRFVVQAVNFSKAVRVRPITRIARLRNSYCVAIGTSRHLVLCSDMSEVGGRPEVTGRLSKRRF
jgi:hypothetical protein